MSVFSDKLNGPYKQAALFLAPLIIAAASRYGVESAQAQTIIDGGCLIAQALMPSVLEIVTYFRKKS